jgi:hypothetical protein
MSNDDPTSSNDMQLLRRLRTKASGKAKYLPSKVRVRGNMFNIVRLTPH